MIKRLLITGALFSALASVAQTTQPILLPHQTFVDGSGAPCVGCQLFSYVAGTTTPLATYTDASGGTPNTNPVILDAAGGAQIWLGSSSYKFILKDSLSSTIWTVDNVSGYLGFCSTAGCAMTGPLSASSATISGAISGASETISGAFSAGSVVSPLINSTYYPTSFAQLQANVATCSTATCTISVTSTVAVTSNTVTPSNVNFTFSNGAQLQPSTGIALTINGPIQAPPVRIFGGAGTVVLGSLNSAVPFEWFGAVGGTSLPSTDSTTAMNACLTAITNGQCLLQALTYKITAPLSITKSNVGIKGVSTGLPSSTLYPTPSPSQITTTSASADIVDLTGTNNSNTVAFNNFQSFTLSRSVIPTGAARGLSMMFADGTIVDGVTSQDSIGNFYIHGMASQGIGRIENSVAIWGYNGVTETAGSLGGFIVDSSGGVNNNSLRLRNDGTFSNLGHSGTAVWTTYGLSLSGTSTHDLHSFHFESANTDYGVFVDGNSAGFFSASDIFLNECVNDGNWISSILIRNIDGTVSMIGGWNTSNFGGAAAPVVDIENSHHVVMTGAKVVLIGNATAGIAANNSNGVNLSNNDLIVNGGGGIPAITFGTTTQSVISGNVMNGGNWGTDVIKLTNTSVSNVVSNNTIQGSATNGITIDAGSAGIAGLETNSVGNPSFGTITNLINDPSQNGTTVVEALRVGDDKIPSSGLLTLNAYKAASGQFYCLHINDQGRVTNTGVDCGAGGGGAVTSVAMSVPSWLSVAGSPVTTSGTLAVTAATGQTPHKVIGTCGAATSFASCSLVAGDLPTTIGPATTFLTNAEFSNGTCTTALTVDPANGNRQKVTLTNANTCALTFTQPASGTATVQLKITQSAVSSFTGGISGCKWPGGVVPTITQTTGAVDMLSAYLDGTNAYCQIAQAFN